MRRDDLETTGGPVAPHGAAAADPYRALVVRIALRHGVPIEQVDRHAQGGRLARDHAGAEPPDSSKAT